jgi:DNA modification methylase
MRGNHFSSASWDMLDQESWATQMENFFFEGARVLRVGGSAIIFMSVIKLETLISIAQKHGFYYKTTGTWHKTNPMPRNMNLHFVNSTESWVYFTKGSKTGTFNNNGKIVHDFVETSVINQGETRFGKHPTQKPIGLMKHFVQLLTNRGDLVLDPFMGSGSSGVASIELDRSFIGIELDKKYFKLAKARISEVEDPQWPKVE